MSLYLAQLTMLVANYIRPAHTPAYKLTDFLFDFLANTEQPKGQTADQMQALLEQVTRSVGRRGKVFPPDATDEEMERYIFGGEVPEMEDDEGDEC